MRYTTAAAPMTAAAFAGEAFSCARANGTFCANSACAADNIVILPDAIMASIFVVVFAALITLSISLLGLISLLLCLVLLITPRRLKDWRPRFI